MSYSRILRGPMGGDHYTQIHNGVFRDTTLTPNEKAIFGWMSTQKQGWETGLAGIAKGVGIGVATARRAVAGLKRRHFLAYGQDRNPDGTKGQGWYFLTDLPAQLAEVGVTDPDLVGKAVDEALSAWMKENRRSQPGCQNGEGGDADAFPQVGTEMTKTGYPVQPHAVPNPPKKTKDSKENQYQEDSDTSYRARTERPSVSKLPHFDPEDDPLEWISEQVDGFDGCEETMAFSMLVGSRHRRGNHPHAIVNKILKDRGA
jgi:hypothetical protein